MKYIFDKELLYKRHPEANGCEWAEALDGAEVKMDIKTGTGIAPYPKTRAGVLVVIEWCRCIEE